MSRTDPPIPITGEMIDSARSALSAITIKYSTRLANKAVKHLYEVLKEEEPEIIWLPDPISCSNYLMRKRLELLHRRTTVKVPGTYRRSLASMVSSYVRRDVRFRESLWWWRSAASPTWPHHRHEAMMGSMSNVLQRSSTARRLLMAVGAQAMGTQFSPRAARLIEAFKDLYATYHLVFIRQGVCVLCEPPKVRLDADGRIHCANGQAIRYSGDIGLYAWHGTNVPAEVIADSDRIDVPAILWQRNAEVRRAMMEIYGMDRLLEQTPANLVNRGKLGKLYQINFHNGTWSRFVQVENATPEPDGSFKKYVLQVRPDHWSANEAVAWTFGFRNAKTYMKALQQET